MTIFLYCFLAALYAACAVLRATAYNGEVHFRFHEQEGLLRLYQTGSKSRLYIYKTIKYRDVLCFRVGRTTARSGEGGAFGVEIVESHVDRNFTNRLSGTEEEVEAVVGALNEMLNEFRDGVP